MPRRTLSAIIIGLSLAAEAPAGATSPCIQAQPQPAAQEAGFDKIVQGASRQEGLFPLYRKEDRLYLELSPGQFGRLFLVIPTMWTSVARGGAGSYLPLRVFCWEKLETKVLLVWKNPHFLASSPEYQRALRNVVPESIVHAFPLEGTPQPGTGHCLIRLDECFLGDLPGLGGMFGSSANPYAVDAKRTVWGRVQAYPENVELEVRYTLNSSRPRSEPTVPDPRVFTVGVRYSISELPAPGGYRPRLADDRIGYFETKVYNYDKLDLDGTTEHYVNRWRLDKKDPARDLSEPAAPIVFWLENTIPAEYRPALRDGILEWNKAFEKVGFRNAVQVREMPDDAAWDPADIRYNTIRWIPSLTGAGGGAMGPSRVNPLTGQILDADVTIRAPLNFLFSYQINRPLELLSAPGSELRLPGAVNPWDEDNLMLGMEHGFGILDMFARGAIKDIEDVPESYIYDALKQLACHEVGHTLGLRHNFKGSTTIPLADLHQADLTARESIGNSIMEYLPVNLALPGVPQGDYFQKTLGAWDYWTIAYGYTPIDAETPRAELPALQKIAARASEPGLAYGTDEDAYDLGASSSSVDPTCVVFDLSDDPLAYSLQDAARIKELWKRLEDRALFEGRSYVYLRRAFESSLARYYAAFSRLGKWIGGLYHTRVHVGDPGNGLPFRVVEYDKQKTALDTIVDNLLTPRAFVFPPAFLQKLQPDRFVDLDAREAGDTDPVRQRLDFSLSHQVRQFHQGILAQLYEPMKLQRILDNETRTDGPKLRLSDYLEALQRSIWSEIGQGQSIGPLRRILQREHLARLGDIIRKAPPAMPSDAVSLLRHELVQLHKSILSSLAAHPEFERMTRAHLEAASGLIAEALDAGSAQAIR